MSEIKKLKLAFSLLMLLPFPLLFIFFSDIATIKSDHIFGLITSLSFGFPLLFLFSLCFDFKDYLYTQEELTTRRYENSLNDYRTMIHSEHLFSQSQISSLSRMEEDKIKDLQFKVTHRDKTIELQTIELHDLRERLVELEKKNITIYDRMELE